VSAGLRPSAPNPEVVTGLRRLARPRPADEPPAAAPAGPRCDLCGTTIDDEHRHLLQTAEHRILCACEPCFAMRAGDPDLRPTGTRVAVLNGFDLPDELWAAFQIPIGLAFFFRTADGGVAAFYPSPAGATQSELYLEAWDDLATRNAALAGLEPEVEALIVDRLSEPRNYAIVPIDRCYELVGAIKASWQGISGGSAVEDAVGAFFAALRERRSVA
jgi:Family of unknown function (DUF5947)